MSQDIFRVEYTPVSDENKAKVKAFKEKAQELFDMLGFDEETLRHASRESAIAATKLEEAVMWAVKGFTSPEVSK